MSRIKEITLNAESIEDKIKKEEFSGVVFVQSENEEHYESAFGLANRAEKRRNCVRTRFGIASGCKLFTAIAIAQLVDQGKISFSTKLKDALHIEFPHFDEKITVHHLLTHSSGIPDYFDEEEMDDFEDLWKQTPMYLVKNLSDFLPLFKDEKMKGKPGQTFHYNNAAFIVLGLIVEQQTGLPFTDYIEEHIFKRCGMSDSGYFSLDNLPKRTAYGYIDREDGTWKTNVYSIPIKGGADGGAYVTAPDMVKLWNALFAYQLLSEEVTRLLLTSHVSVKEGVDYGYGVWINKRADNSIYKYHIMGYDPGVSFHSAYYPESKVTLAIPSNKNKGPFQVMKAIEQHL